MKRLFGISMFKKTRRRKPRCLACFIKKRRWKKFVKTLASSPINDQNIEDIVCPQCHDCRRHPTLLHCACRSQPSLRAIKALVESDPKSLQTLDSKSRSPLHVACEYGAYPEVIQYLVEQHQEAVVVQDSYGNIPLHLAFLRYDLEIENSLDLHEDTISFLNLRKVIHLLCKSDPMSVTMRNDKGMNALDHAVAFLDDNQTIHVIEALTVCAERGESGASWLVEIGPTLDQSKHRQARVIPV